MIDIGDRRELIVGLMFHNLCEFLVVHYYGLDGKYNTLKFTLIECQSFPRDRRSKKAYQYSISNGNRNIECSYDGHEWAVKTYDCHNNYFELQSMTLSISEYRSLKKYIISISCVSYQRCEKFAKSDHVITLSNIIRESKNIDEMGIFTENTMRKKTFLAACKVLKDDVDLVSIDKNCPYGGLIGVDDSVLEPLLNWSKVIRLHAALHDASGYMKQHYQCGSGYCYKLPYSPQLLNKCVLGHVTGLLYCSYLALFSSEYKHFDI